MLVRVLVLASALFLSLSATAATTGVLMNDDGKPVAGARVSAYALESGEARRLRWLSDTPERPPIATGETDSKGRFSLEIAKEHAVVTLQAEAAGYAPHAVRIERDDDLGALALAAATMRAGRITAGGKPVANAKVIWQSGAEFIARTDEEGRYTAPDPDKWAGRLSVIHPQYAVLDENLRMGGRSKITVDHSLQTGVTISGRVMTADGKTAVTGAAVSVDGWPAGATKEDGSFTIEHAPAKWQWVEASAGAMAARRARGSDLMLKMQPAIVVRGVVRDLKTQLPLAGADVSLFPAARFDGRSVDSSFTDEKGNFSITNVSPGSYRLMTNRPGYSFLATSVSIAPDEKSIRTVAGTRKGRVTGLVVNERKEPVAGARVVPQAARGGGMPGMFMLASDPTVTAPDGTFRLDVGAEADIQVEARKKGFPSAQSATMKLAPGERRTGVVLTIPSGVAVTGRVVDHDQNPLAGVTVVAGESQGGFGGPRRIMLGAQRQREEELIRTAADGSFSMQLKEGTYDIRFEREGFAPKTVPAHEVKGGSRPIEVTLAPGATISGRVTRDGAGVPQVRVGVFSDDVQENTETGPDGAFTLSDLPAGQMMVMASKPDEFIQVNRPVKAPATDVVIEVPGGGRISGRVFDKETKQPITTFDAGLSGSRGGGGMVMMGPNQTRPFTSDDGSFVLENVPLGPATVVVTAAGYTVATLPNVDVEEGQATDVEVALERGVRIVGRVTDASGNAVSGANVRVAPRAVGRVVAPQMMGSMVTTDASGEYVIEAAEPGEQTLSFQRAGFVATEKTAELKRPETRVDVQLSSGVKATGVVVTESGTPVADAMVTAYSGAAGTRGTGARTDANGAFQIEALAPARYTFSASKEGYPRASVEDVDIAGGAPVRLVLRSGGTIFGRVEGLQPDELAQAVVMASGRNGSSQVSVDGSGNYRLEGAPTGTVRLVARTGGFGGGRTSQSVSVEVATGASVQQDIRFATGHGSVRGRVTRDGRPLPNAFVSFSSRDPKIQTSARVQTDAQGQYEVSGLEDGTYTVFAGDMERSSNFSTTYELSGSGTFDIDIRSSTVRGVVVDKETGEPVGQAVVELRPRDPSGPRYAMNAAQTDASGGFTLPNVSEGSYQITAQKPGYSNTIDDLEVGDSTPEVTIKLGRTAGVVVRVIDGRDGRALSAMIRVTDAQQRVVYETGPRPGSLPEVQTLGLEPGTYQATVMVSGYATRNIQITSPGSMTVPMTPGGTVIIRSKGSETRRGRLMGADGQLYMRGMAPSFAIDRSPGVTRLDRIPAGSYTLQILGNNGEVVASTQVVVAEGATVEVSI